MFNFIDIGERAGSGIPNIFRVGKEQKLSEPVITEEYNPDRTTLSLSTIKIGDKNLSIKARVKNSILEFLTDYAAATTTEVSEYIGL